MKKATCKCGADMKLKSEGQVDTSTWKIRKRTRPVESSPLCIKRVTRAPRQTKVKAKTVYRMHWSCTCGLTYTMTGRSRADALRRL